MNVFGVLNGSLYFIMGTVLLIYLVRHWNDENKQATKYSELLYGIFYFVLGFYVIFYLDVANIEANSAFNVQMLLFIGYMAVLFWLLPVNLWYNWYKCRKNPALIENDVPTRKYGTFLCMLNEKYAKNTKNDDVIKDLSRKLLHVIMLSIIIGLNSYANSISDRLTDYGLTPIAFRNTLYLFLAGLFVFMFTLEDLYRMCAFHCCPNWARNWLTKSLDPRSESYTFISSVPFLQTMLLFIFAPIQVLFAAAVVSCVADSVASIVGKSMGKHKLANVGFYPNKSVEGLLAGVFATLIGVILVFVYYPIPNVGPMLIFSIALVISLIFALIDLFGKYIADNVLNTLIPGIVIWGMLIVFS